jgi:crotonobetaine/carnitine-CoA ligase
VDINGNRNLRDLLREKAELHHDKTFLLFEDKDQRSVELTYGEFFDQVSRLSQAFLKFNVKKGDHVAIHLPNCIEFMTSWFALASIGAVIVPTNPLSTEAEMEYILHHSESVLLITEEEYLEKFTTIRDRLPHLREILLARYDAGDFQSRSLTTLMAEAKPQVITQRLNLTDIFIL